MNTTDFEVWRGNSYRVVGWHLPFDLTGSEIVLTVKWKGGTITKSSSEGGLVVEATAIEGETVPVVYWTPTVAESRQIPLGRVARYELERRVTGGEHRTYANGYVTGTGGDNGD